MMQKHSSNPLRVIKASKYSLSGLSYAWKEGAFRLECYISISCIALSLIFNYVWWHTLVISLAWLFVLIIEILNSAIEACIDRVGTDLHELSKTAKDLASAAVLLSITMAVIISTILIVKL
jgi:diacylglycerol kinase (ATP)